ncbi:MAG: hypothetical protein ABIF82_09315 [Planctomycetota bacterium]
MTIGVEMSLSGGKELDAKLMSLGRKGKTIMAAAVKKGLLPIRPRAKSNARQMVGGNMGSLFAKALIVRAVKSRRGAYVMARLGLSKDYNDHFVSISKATGKRHYIPAAIEYGHDNAAAIPFQRRAADAGREEAVAAVTAEARRRIALEVAKTR